MRIGDCWFVIVIVFVIQFAFLQLVFVEKQGGQPVDRVGECRRTFGLAFGARQLIFTLILLPYNNTNNNP